MGTVLGESAGLKQNRSRFDSLGAPRGGASLLAGLATYGGCGRRMHVAYPGRPPAAHYRCQRSDPVDRCENQDLPAWSVDELVERQVLLALEPAALELSLKAEETIRREQGQLSAQWRQNLERAHYETDRARRQYDAVEPENRLVARELEQRWEKALLEERRIREEHARFRAEWPHELSDEDRENIRRLSADIPALWASPSTTIQDRQIVVRQLVEKVVVHSQGATELLDVTIHWVGGFVMRGRKLEDPHLFDATSLRLLKLAKRLHGKCNGLLETDIAVQGVLAHDQEFRPEGEVVAHEHPASRAEGTVDPRNRPADGDQKSQRRRLPPESAGTPRTHSASAPQVPRDSRGGANIRFAAGCRSNQRRAFQLGVRPAGHRPRRTPGRQRSVPCHDRSDPSMASMAPDDSWLGARTSRSLS